jgi:hypothetical protein
MSNWRKDKNLQESKRKSGYRKRYRYYVSHSFIGEDILMKWRRYEEAFLELF